MSIAPRQIAIAVIFLACAIVAGVSLCIVKQAKRDAQTARTEATELRARLTDAEAENAQLRAVLARAYAAMERAGEAVEEAAKSHAERVEKIDTVDPDWLMCPLPDGVRAGFADDTDGDHNAATGIARAM